MSTSPLPWKAEVREIYDSNGTNLTMISGWTKPASEDTANAALIVRAVNSHAQLVAALETLVNIVGTVAPTHRSALLAGESALSAAKGDK